MGDEVSSNFHGTEKLNDLPSDFASLLTLLLSLLETTAVVPPGGNFSYLRNARKSFRTNSHRTAAKFMTCLRHAAVCRDRGCQHRMHELGSDLNGDIERERKLAASPFPNSE